MKKILSILVFAFLVSGCVVGLTTREPQTKTKGVELFAGAKRVRGLKPNQICNINASKSPPPAQTLTTHTFRDMVKKTRSSVVNLYVARSTPARVHILMIPVPGIPALHLPGEALGSGFLCSSKGYILSNAHVVNHSKTLSAKTHQGKVLPLELIAADWQADLALLRIIDAGSYPAVKMAASHRLTEGDFVVAIGNPLGFNHTVSHGIVSQTSRSMAELMRKESQKQEDMPTFLQTDTPINPGNSGGPLFDMSGQVVGINTAIARGAQGISFTIPTERVEQFLKEVSQKASSTDLKG